MLHPASGNDGTMPRTITLRRFGGRTSRDRSSCDAPWGRRAFLRGPQGPAAHRIDVSLQRWELRSQGDQPGERRQQSRSRQDQKDRPDGRRRQHADPNDDEAFHAGADCRGRACSCQLPDASGGCGLHLVQELPARDRAVR